MSDNGDTLRDLDLAPRAYHYERWGRDVHFRRLSTREFLKMQTDFGQLQGAEVDVETAAHFYAELLSITCTDPSASADDWLECTTIETVTELGQAAMNAAGISAAEKKTNSTAGPSGDSRSNSAASSESSTQTDLENA